MSQTRLYVDEDAAQQAVVDGHRNRGIDVLTVVEAGFTSATDLDQLEFAASQGRAIYSLNVEDFCRLHGEFQSARKDHAGVIVIPRQRYSIGEKIRRLIELVDSVSAEEMRNRLEFLKRCSVAKTSSYGLTTQPDAEAVFELAWEVRRLQFLRREDAWRSRRRHTITA